MDVAGILVWVVQGLVAMFVTLLWTNHRDVKTKADRAAEDLAAFKLFVAEKYTTGDELREAVNSINRAFDQYSSRLDIRFDRLEERILEGRRQ